MSEVLKIRTSARLVVIDTHQPVTVTNRGPGTVYYGAATVSSTSNDGSVASGSSVDLAIAKYFVSASTSQLVITPAAQVGTGTGKTALTIEDSGSQNSGLTIGTDTNLYRSAANTLKTDDALTVTGVLSASAAGKTAITVADSGAQSSGLTIGADTNLYRSAADTLKTDDALTVATVFRHLGTTLGFYNATAAAQPAAYTQTYATATRTHSNPTAAAVAVTAATNTGPYGYSQAQADAIVAAVNALVIDVANVKQVLNSVIDDDQTLGLKA